MTTKAIAGLIPAMQSTALLGANLDYLKRKKKKLTGLVGLGVGNIVGASMIKETSNIIGKL